MIDLKLLRADPERVRASQHARGEDAGLVDALLTADSNRRAAITARDGLRSEQKIASDAVRSATDKPAAAANARELKDAVTAAEKSAAAADEAVRVAHLAIPNVVADGVPPGGEQDFRVVVPGEPGLDGGRDHLEIGELLGAIDSDRGAKVSGSRFAFLTGVGALLELALVQLAVQHAVAAGFTPVITPALVKPESMEGTGFLGAHADEVYRLADDDLYLVGTSEVPLAAYRSGEVLDAAALPLRYAGFSSCFRREAGSYGKDTRGIIRVHQFDKVEMFTYTTVAESWAEHERMLAIERAFLDALELPYRVIEVAAGDLGTSAARKYDCEAWLPSQGRWLELTSTSNCTDFQARRLATRIRAEGENEIAATLNGTLCAVGRSIVALLENHQQPDGSVVIPAALRPALATFGVGDVLMPPLGVRPRLVASDLDGTLVRSDGTVSDRSLAALKLVEAAGSTLVVVTGRPVRWITDLLPHLGNNGVALVSNGAGVYDLATGALSRTDAIAPDEVAEMIKLLRRRVPDGAFAAERVNGYVREAGYVTPFADKTATDVVGLDELASLPLLKLLVRSNAHDADSLLAAGREVVGEHLGTLTHSSNAGLIEISAAGVTKASAVERLAAELGVGADGVIAFGDMPNDVPLLRWAGNSYAVANAHPEARAAAKSMTVSNDDDGVAVVLEGLFG